MMNPIPNRYNTTEITFYTENAIKAGSPVSITSDGVAIAAPKGHPFYGICTKSEGNYVTVALAGIITAKYSGEINNVGYLFMSSDGEGNIQFDLSSDYEYRVLKYNKEDQTVTIIL